MPVPVSAGAGLLSLSGRSPHGYTPHPLHSGADAYPETNCYTDMLIELLHATGHEPVAMLGHLVRMDFEGDQWTFFKPPPEDLERLYGIDIHEMQPYRPLALQIADQIERGRTVVVEVDSWFLPDTISTSYQTEHVKTSIAADAIDVPGRRLRYFHNGGLWELSGEDFSGALRSEAQPAWQMPPYAELVRFDAGEALPGEALRAQAAELLRRHLGRVPRRNPFEAFGEQLLRDLPALLGGELREYHAYAFATVRMAGAAFQLAAAHVRWLLGAEGEAAAAALDDVVGGCKTLSFRLARRKPFEPEPRVAALAERWQAAIGALATSVR